MPMCRSKVLMALFASTVVIACSLPGRALPNVEVIKTPDGGIQPQAVLDPTGMLHLIYFKGNPAAGDIFYVRKGPGQSTFSQPLHVNSQPGSAVAIGSVRGGQLAVGKNGRVHVVWNGSGKTVPPGPAHSAPMLYARINNARSAFEPQRNLMQFTSGLDGGGSVAADGKGNVYVVWHGAHETRGEGHRRVWISKSTNDGATFARERPATSDPTGACGCCGLRAYADSRGDLYILYRSAFEEVNRDTTLLNSKDQGRTFKRKDIHPWKINACPMTTASISEMEHTALLAWETNGQVYYARVDPTNLQVSSPIPAPGEGGTRKHPVLASNTRGEAILVWTVGTAWQKGGSIAWQVFDRQGRPGEIKGGAEGLPVWGLATVFARTDGGFTIID